MSNHRAAILKMQNVSKVAARKRLINTSSHTHTPAVHLPSTTSHCADWLSVATREMRILLSGFPTSFLSFFLLKDFNNHNRISLHKSKLLKMKALNDTKEQTHEKARQRPVWMHGSWAGTGSLQEEHSTASEPQRHNHLLSVEHEGQPGQRTYRCYKDGADGLTLQGAICENKNLKVTKWNGSNFKSVSK